jgi:hypothetical protein
MDGFNKIKEYAILNKIKYFSVVYWTNEIKERQNI